MLKEFLSKLMGLFASRGKATASGMYGQPTFAQVERLIAAAKGEEYAPPARPGLYSQPTFDQFERLISAVGGMKSAVSDIPVGDYGDDPYSVAERLDTVLRAIRGDTVPDDRTMYFLALEDDSTVAMAASGSAPAVSLEYSLGDVGDWKPFIVGTTTVTPTTVTLAKGQWVRIRATGDGVNAQFATSDSAYNMFVLGGSIAVGGNSMSLFYNDYSPIAAQKSFPDATKGYILAYLFREARALKDASRLLLPATTLAANCYRGMFSGCTSLTAAPALPATTLASNCYRSMFYSCSSLTAAPSLPATTLVSSCYYGMFISCSSLTAAPELPATTLASSCYNSMFKSCSSLTTAPALPATTLASSCYSYMFYSCSSLTTAPALPATTLVSSCYSYMFSGCSGLRYVEAYFGSFPYEQFATNATNNWLNEVNEKDGEFHCKAGLAISERGASTVPVDWTIVEGL